MTTVEPPSNPLSDPASLPRHMGMARGIAWKYHRRPENRVPFDDLYGEALYALAYAASLYKPSTGVPFEKYVTMVICHRLRYFGARWRHRDVAGGFRWIPDTKGAEREPTAQDQSPDGRTDIERQELWAKVAAVVPGRKLEVLRMRFVEEQSMEQIGRRLGVCRQRACQLSKRAVEELREAWGPDD